MATTVSVGYADGFSFLVPNEVVYQGDGFYISYNDFDTNLHGSDTTCLALEKGLWFYTLNGDHRLQYLEIAGQGFDACFDYFVQNLDKIGKYSHKPNKKK